MKILIPNRKPNMPYVYGEFEGLPDVTAYFTPEKSSFSFNSKIYTNTGVQVAMKDGRFVVLLPPSAVAGLWSMRIPMHMETPIKIRVPMDGTHQLSDLIVQE